MRTRTLTVIAIIGLLMLGSATTAVASAALPRRPDHADWEQIKAAARTRNVGLAPHRTARFRSYAGSLGLTDLSTIHPLAPGPCQRALTYLYGNLLDLRDAQPGENWAPLRRFVATEPSIRACAPR